MNVSHDAAKTTPDVSVVIVNWNVSKLLADCLDSLQRTSEGLSLEVWVVDNASSDGSIEMLQSRYPWVRLIANEDNRGFARANNQAFALAQGRHVFILNPDTIVMPGAMQVLTRFLDEHPDVGMVGPHEIDGVGAIVRDAARRHFTMRNAFLFEMLRVQSWPWLGPHLQRRFVYPYDYDRTQAVEAISGGAMLVRRELLLALHGFDETFPHCGEDVDLCFRIYEAGKKIYYLPVATIVHFVGQSRKQIVARVAMLTQLSDQEIVRHRNGAGWALLYRILAPIICIPQLLLIGGLKCVCGKESIQDFKNRLTLSWFFIRWNRPQ